MFPKRFFFSFEWEASASRLRVLGWARTPVEWKKAFWKHFECENSYCTKSRNLSWVGADFSWKWLNFPKNAWTFALFEIWSACRCDMKIICDVFDNLDTKLLSSKNLCHHLICMHSHIALKVKNVKKLRKKFQKKVQMILRHPVDDVRQLRCVYGQIPFMRSDISKEAMTKGGGLPQKLVAIVRHADLNNSRPTLAPNHVSQDIEGV